MRVVFCGTGWLPIVDAIRERLPDGASIHVRDPEAPIVGQLRDANVILPSNCFIDAEAIAAPADLRLIQQPAAGVDVVDLGAARARGVPVCNAPGTNFQSMAEAALLLMLAVARRLPAARASFARGELGVPLGIELCGKTLGIIGLGRSGRALAAAAEGLGMRVVGVGSASPRSELDAMLAAADVISLHCPLTEDTRGLLDGPALARLKPGGILINCARGPIVDRDALERALDSGRLAGVGLDVYWDEPWDPDDPLFARTNVVTLPHVGGSTRESFDRIADVVTGNIRRVIAGDDPRHRVI